MKFKFILCLALVLGAGGQRFTNFLQVSRWLAGFVWQF